MTALFLLLAWLAHPEPGVLVWNFANGAAGPSDFEPNARPTRINGGVASDKPFVFSTPVAEYIAEGIRATNLPLAKSLSDD